MRSLVRIVAACLLLMVAGAGPAWAAEPTISFPASADTDAWLTTQINRWFGASVDQKTATLNEELTDSETGVDLASVPSNWPTEGFYIQIHSEYMYVEDVTGTTLTVTRGVGGATASTHVNGATVYFVTTAETFEHMKDSIQAIQNALLNGTLAGIFTTLSSGAAGFSVDADGDTTVKSLTVTKVNGVAGSTLWPEANSSDTDGVGFMGPASATRRLYFQFEDGDPVAGEIMKLGTPAAVGDHFVSQVTYEPYTLDTIANGASFEKVGIAANNPTTSSSVHLAVDVNNNAVEVYGTVSRLISTGYHAELTIPEPDKQQLILDAWPIFHVDADFAPFGITIINCQITLSADSAYTVVFEEWAGDPPAWQADIETVSTGAGDSYMEDTTISNNVVDADDYVYVDLPTTDVPMVQVQVNFTVNEGN